MSKIRFLLPLIAALAVGGVAQVAQAADNLPAKDSTNTTRILGKKEVAGVLYDQVLIGLATSPTTDAMAQLHTYVDGLEASATAIDGHIDGVEALLTTEVSNTSAILAKLPAALGPTTTAGSLSIVPATSSTFAITAAALPLPSGAATETTLSAQSAKLPSSLGAKTGAGSFSVVPASDGFAVTCASGCSGGAQKAEDSASADADLGTVMQVIQKATPADTAGTDGDYAPLQMKNGRLWTDAGLNLGASGDATCATDTGACAINAKLSRIAERLTTIDGRVDGLEGAIGTISDTAVTAGFSNCSLIACIKPVTNSSLDTAALAVNQTQVNGVAMLAGNGATGTGSPRVTIANDNTAIPTNIAQMNGVATTMGNGASGTGVQRVTLASDSTGQVALAAGTATIGGTYGFADTVTVTFNRPADAASYTALDMIADSTSAPTAGGFTITGACRSNAGSVIIPDVWVMSNDTAALAAKILLLDTAVTTTPNDNAAEALSDTDAAKVQAEIPFTLTARANNASAHLQNLNIQAKCLSGATTLKFLVQATGGTLTTVSANTYTFKFKIIQVN